MEDTEVASKLAELDQRSKSNQQRIDRLEESTEALTEMAGSIKLLAYQQTEANGKIDKIDQKVTALEREPADKYRRLIGYIIGALCSAGVGAILTYIIR